MHMRARIVSRISQGLALLVMGIALASPGVHAAERKKAVAKKAASTTVAKRTPAKSSASDGVLLACSAMDCSRYTSPPAMSTSATPKPSTAQREIDRVTSSSA